jgi:SNF2 family DNA or RNA helicase
MLLRRHCHIVPFVHQANGLACMMERLERFGSFGLLHDMGCGKTLTVLGGFLAMHAEGRAESMLVVCPSSVVSAWKKESLGITARGGTEIDVLSLDHPSVKRRKRDLEEWLARRDLARRYGQVVLPGIVALNYEGTWRMEAELKAAGFDIDVCDESQRLKAPGSNQSKAMHRIGKAASFVLQAWTGAAMLTPFRPATAAPMRIIMTGTPVPEGGLDWYGQFRFLDDRVLGTNHTNFKRQFAIEIDCGTFRKVVINPHTLPELERRVMERVHRVSKEEAVDLPEQTHARIEFELDPKARRLYDDLVRDSIAFVEGGGGLDFLTQAASLDMGDESEILGDNVLTRMLRLQQITGGFMQVDGRDSVEPIDSKKNAKLSCLTDLMETLRDANAKLVIFHRFTHEGQAIIKAAERISGKNTPVSYINGQVKGSARGKMIDQFQDGDAWFFVGQIQACAEGITLHAASDGAFYSSPFASAVFQQALARYHRIGQTQPVTHHHLLALDTIDETILDTQVEKKEVADEIVDGGWQRFLLRRGR